MDSPVDAIQSAVRAVTRYWAKQRKAEERNRNARLYRRRRLMRSERVTIREVAFDVMGEAYAVASGPQRLPVKPRQIMYVARPEILRRTGNLTLDDVYFTQTLLVDYMEEYDCSDWDIIWDARGHFFEPHTGREVALGTLEVRQYLGLRPSFDPPKLTLAFPTTGPENRYRNVLFIEKEGFHPILQAARLQNRFDIGLMSTKGMSVTAARRLIDKLIARGVERIFVLHDFDISGFSIFGTLGTNSRRYTFDNPVHVVDIGLRLPDVLKIGLQSEPVPVEHVIKWRKRTATLRRHGAMPDEIDFLRAARVELNAMTSPQLIDFIETKFAQHGVAKLVPENEILSQQARRVIKQRLIDDAITKIVDELIKKAELAPLPKNLRKLVQQTLKDRPELSWDEAITGIL